MIENYHPGARKEVVHNQSSKEVLICIYVAKTNKISNEYLTKKSYENYSFYILKGKQDPRRLDRSKNS